MKEKSSTYLKGFNWCKQILNSYLFLNLGSRLCVFLYEIENKASNDDSYLWVIVGDLPSMYLDVHGAKTTIEALETYFELAQEWVDCVNKELSIENCYPFDAIPSIELANMLQKRINFIKYTLLSNIDDLSCDLIIEAH